MAARMTCQDVIGLMLEYLESTLDDDVVRAFETHLEGCAPCRAYLATYRRTVAVAGEAQRVEMPPEMRRHLAALLAERLRQPL